MILNAVVLTLLLTYKEVSSSSNDGLRRISIENLVDKLTLSADGIRILDIRTDLDQEVGGFIHGSELMEANSDGEYDINIYG